MTIESPNQIGQFVVLGELPENSCEQGDEKSDPTPLELTIRAGAVIRSHSVIYTDVQIGKNFHTGHGVLVREGTRIGDEVSIGSGSVIEHHVAIGNRVRIHSNVFIPEFSKIEDDVWIGPNAVLTNARYPNSETAKANLQGPVLKSKCIIGANATLLPGITIGESALVGAGAVVTRDVLPGVVVAGNPAREIRKMSEIQAYRRK